MDTRNQILDVTEALIQERGFFGFSFADVAKTVGIKKASIYYYFPAKAQLGQAVVSRYRDRMRSARANWDTAEGIDVWSELSAYLEPMIRLGRTPKAACLCGVLGGEFRALPDELKDEVNAFFDEHIAALTTLFTIGQANGEFGFAGKPSTMAKMAFGMLEGSMLLKRTQHDPKVFDETLAGILGVLKGNTS